MSATRTRPNLTPKPLPLHKREPRALKTPSWYSVPTRPTGERHPRATDGADHEVTVRQAPLPIVPRESVVYLAASGCCVDSRDYAVAYGDVIVGACERHAMAVAFTSRRRVV
jgi:hypothetical protein